MSNREVRALLAAQGTTDNTSSQKRPTTRSKLRRQPRDDGKDQTEDATAEELHETVDDQQLAETQRAMEEWDNQLREVSAECERVSGKAHWDLQGLEYLMLYILIKFLNINPSELA